MDCSSHASLRTTLATRDDRNDDEETDHETLPRHMAWCRDETVMKPWHEMKKSRNWWRFSLQVLCQLCQLCHGHVFRSPSECSPSLSTDRLKPCWATGQVHHWGARNQASIGWAFSSWPRTCCHPPAPAHPPAGPTAIISYPHLFTSALQFLTSSKWMKHYNSTIVYHSNLLNYEKIRKGNVQIREHASKWDSCSALHLGGGVTKLHDSKKGWYMMIRWCCKIRLSDCFSGSDFLTAIGLKPSSLFVSVFIAQDALQILFSLRRAIKYWILLNAARVGRSRSAGPMTSLWSTFGATTIKAETWQAIVVSCGVVPSYFSFLFLTQSYTYSHIHTIL